MSKLIYMRENFDNKEGNSNGAQPPFPRVLRYKRRSDITEVKVHFGAFMVDE
jgi:hypothetical protein